MKKFFLCAAMAVLALVGCEKQNQSSLDFDQVEKAATISGTLVAYVNHPKEATQTMPLAGVRLYVQVDSKTYVDGAEGAQQFETKTAEDGSFKITVKTGAKTISGAHLYSDDFKYGFENDTIYYEHVDVTLDDLNSNDVRLEYVVAKADDVLNQTDGEGIVKGILTYDAGVVEMPDKSHENAQVAAANVQLIARVKYFAGTTDEVVKKFVAKTNAKGEFTFNIPAQNAGNGFEIDVPQFEGTYTKFVNNKYQVLTAYYAKDKLVVGKTIKPAETLQINQAELQLKEADRSTVDPTTKSLEMVVKGKISKEVEVMQTKDDHQLGPKEGTTAYKEGKLVIEAYNSELDKSIFYDASTDEKGEYEKKIAIYDAWDLTKVTIKVYTEGEFVETFKHYYLGFTTEEKEGVDLYRKKINQWYGQFTPQTDNQNQASTQNLNGTYKTKTKVEANPSIFFDVNMPELILQFTPEDKNIVRGIGNAIDKEERVTYDSPTVPVMTDLYSAGIDMFK